MNAKKPSARRLAFTKVQIAELKRRKLLPEQVELLQKLLPELQHLENKEPAKTLLLARLDEISKPLQVAFESLKALDSGCTIRGTDAVAIAIRSQLESMAIYSKKWYPLQLSEIIEPLLTLLQVTRKEVASQDQRRHRAPWRAIEAIHVELIRGFCKHHHLKITTFARIAADPRLRIRPAVSRRGAFMEVAHVCFEAAGFGTSVGVERAIARYLTHLRIGLAPFDSREL